jgi:glycosyltransferase involved in cell wall biosynthesis
MKNRNNPLVSVIIPAYNQAQYLASAIQSVLAQTHHNFEIIVIDDGSTDNTPAVAQQFGNAIRYIRQENHGLSSARNTGIRATRGEFIGFLDSDDLWEPDFLSTTVSVLQADHTLAGVYTGVRHIDENGADLPAVSRRVVSPQNLYWVLVRANFVIPCSVLIRLTVLDEIGLFDERLIACEDWDLWLRISREHKMKGLSVPLAKYRLHKKTMTEDPLRMLKAVIAVVEKHFGPAPRHWNEASLVKRRAYGGVYFFYARSYIWQGNYDKATSYLRMAFKADEKLFNDPSLFYELALGNQSRGERGFLKELPIRENEKFVINILDKVFEQRALAEYKNCAYGRAYLALGLVAYGKPQLDLARLYLLKSLWYDICLIIHPQVLPTFVKACLPEVLLKCLREFRQRILTKKTDNN